MNAALEQMWGPSGNGRVSLRLMQVWARDLFDVDVLLRAFGDVDAERVEMQERSRALYGTERLLRGVE